MGYHSENNTTRRTSSYTTVIVLLDNRPIRAVSVSPFGVVKPSVLRNSKVLFSKYLHRWICSRGEVCAENTLNCMEMIRKSVQIRR